MQLSILQTEKIQGLVNLFANSAVLTDEELDRLSKIAIRDTASKMLELGFNYGQASGAPDFYNQPEISFRAFMQSVNHDFEWQCNTVSESFKRYCNQGEIPTPYFPMRIAIMLRKAKELELEREFLAAWCRHFPFRSSGKYAELFNRAIKTGAIAE